MEIIREETSRKKLTDNDVKNIQEAIDKVTTEIHPFEPQRKFFSVRKDGWNEDYVEATNAEFQQDHAIDSMNAAIDELKEYFRWRTDNEPN